MRKTAVTCAALIVLVLPAAANAGWDDAGACGQYHGIFDPPDGFGQIIGDRASSGGFQGGIVGETNSNPACHTTP